MEHHGPTEEIVALGKKVKPPLLAFVHIDRKVRGFLSSGVQAIAEDLNPTVVLVPEDGDSMRL